MRRAVRGPPPPRTAHPPTGVGVLIVRLNCRVLVKLEDCKATTTIEASGELRSDGTILFRDERGRATACAGDEALVEFLQLADESLKRRAPAMNLCVRLRSSASLPALILQPMQPCGRMCGA